MMIVSFEEYLAPAWIRGYLRRKRYLRASNGWYTSVAPRHMCTRVKLRTYVPYIIY